MRLSIGRCRINELLYAKGWTQQELAERTGIKKQTISAYCTSFRVKMPLLNAVLISDALSVQERDLYEWEHVKTPVIETDNQ